MSTLLLTSKTRLPSIPARSARPRIDRSRRLVLHRPEVVEQGVDPDRLDQHGRRTGTGSTGASCRATTAAGCGRAGGNGTQVKRSRRPSPRPAASARRSTTWPGSGSTGRRRAGGRSLVIGQRQVDHEDEREVEDDIEADRGEPPPPEPARQVAEPGGEARERDQARARAGPRSRSGPRPHAALGNSCMAFSVGWGTSTGTCSKESSATRGPSSLETAESCRWAGNP